MVTLLRSKYLEILRIFFSTKKNKIRSYLKDINNLERSETWKNQLTIANNFISSIDDDEERVMHSKKDNIEIMVNDKADEVIKELFDSLEKYISK